MNNNYTVQRIQAESFTDNDWKFYFDHRAEWRKIRDCYNLHKSWKALKVFSISRMKDGKAIYILSKNNKTLGDFSFDINNKNFPAKRFTYFRNGLMDEVLNSDLLNLIAKEALVFDPKSKFIAILSNNGLNDFIEQLNNVQIGSYADALELTIKDAKLDVIENWYKTLPLKFPKYRIQFYKDIPDDLMEEYIDVFKKLLNDMPPNSELGEFNLSPAAEKKRQERAKKLNHTSYKYLIFNEKNQLIAHTNININKNNLKHAGQYMTGVLKEYRRLGLAKWLKSSMFKKVTHDFPKLESIKTNTHPDNHGSRKVSQQMGFVITGSEKEFLIPLNHE